MGRRTTTWTAVDGRDQGKVFFLTEMSAARGERWASRVLHALGRADVEMPEHLIGMGMAGIAAVGVRGLVSLSFPDAEYLMDEMFTCIRRVEDKIPEGRPLVEDDTEEVMTRFRLRGEVLDLHLGFSLRAELLKLVSARSETGSPTTSTSADELAP